MNLTDVATDQASSLAYRGDSGAGDSNAINSSEVINMLMYLLVKQGGVIRHLNGVCDAWAFGRNCGGGLPITFLPFAT
jgi:hypothetical protein